MAWFTYRFGILILRSDQREPRQNRGDSYKSHFGSKDRKGVCFLYRNTISKVTLYQNNSMVNDESSEKHPIFNVDSKEL